MEGIEAHSQEFPTQEFEDSVVAAEAGVMPGFVTVNRSKKFHWLMFPVSCFDKGLSRNSMFNWATNNLRKVASIKPASFKITTLPTTEGEPAQFLLFQVYTAEEAKAACKCGSKDTEGVITRFEIYTADARALQERRMLKVISLSFNTTADHISAALSKYGCVESVTTHFNAKATMINATVIFKYAESIDKLKDRYDILKKAYVRVRDDIGTLTWLGDTAITYDSTLTRKLAQLPTGLTPVDIKRIFNKEFKTPNGVRAFHSITMPVNLRSKQRHPEAYIHFATLEQFNLATAKPFEIEGHATRWIEVGTPTCFQCGYPDHFVNSCRVKMDRATGLSLRRSNISSIKGRTQSPATATRPFTQAPITDPSSPAKKSTTYARTSPAMSYSSVAGARRNHGSAASNPITIGSHTPQAKAPTPAAVGLAATPVTNIPTKTAAQSAAPKPSIASSSAPVNLASHFATTINNLALKQTNDIASVRAEFQAATDALTANMNQQFAQIMQALQGIGSPQVISSEMSATNTTPALDPEDIDIPEPIESPILAPIIVVPDSMPSTPTGTEAPFSEGAHNGMQAHDRPESSLANKAPYSVNILRPHSSGESSAAKTDYYQVESELTRKKGKGVKTDSTQDIHKISEMPEPDLSQQLMGLQKTIENMSALIEGLREDLEQQRTENRSLKETLARSSVQFADGTRANWATSQFGQEFGECPHLGDGTPTQNTNVVNNTRDIQSDTESL